jgi:L-ribulokinase
MWPIDHVLKNSNHLDQKQKELLKNEMDSSMIQILTEHAQSIPIEESLPIALDWINGRRTPDANQNLKMAISQLSLGSKAPHIFKALIYAICFGSKKILDRFESEGIQIDTVIGIGGVARKSNYIMQVLSNTLDKPIKVAASDYAPALGAAIYASVAAGIYPDVISASKVLGSTIEAEYHPNPDHVQHMKDYYKKYEALADFVESSIASKL